MRVRAIRFSALGDILLTLPALRLLRSRWPEAELEFVTRAPFGSLLEHVDFIDKVTEMALRSSLSTFRRRLAAGSPTVVLDFHSSIRSRLLTVGSGAPVLRSRGAHLSRRSVVNRRSHSGVAPVWWRHMATVSALGGPFLHPSAVNRFTRLPASVSGDLSFSLETPLVCAPPWARDRIATRLPPGQTAVALLPGARWATKMWPAHLFTELASLIEAAGIVPVVLGGPGESALVRAVASGAGASMVCTGSWGEILAWLERCRGAVGNDSGLTHLAEAVGTPVLSLFGPTVPALGFAPRLAASRVVQTSLPCRPCSLHGGPRCPIESHACLEKISPQAVMRHVARWRGLPRG